MTKEDFFKIMESYMIACEELDKFEETTGITIFDSPIIQSYEEMFNCMLKSEFVDEGVELIYDWLYCDDLEDDLETLWNNLNDYRRN